jgi:hypothetical protein
LLKFCWSATDSAAKNLLIASRLVHVVPPMRIISSLTPRSPRVAQRRSVAGLTGRPPRRAGRLRAACPSGMRGSSEIIADRPSWDVERCDCSRSNEKEKGSQLVGSLGKQQIAESFEPYSFHLDELTCQDSTSSPNFWRASFLPPRRHQRLSKVRRVCVLPHRLLLPSFGNSRLTIARDCFKTRFGTGAAAMTCERSESWPDERSGC